MGKSIRSTIEDFQINQALIKNRLIFYESFSNLIIAGVSVSDSLEALLDEEPSKAMRNFLQKFRKLVESGEPVWKALQKFKVISDYQIQLVKIGEASGSLPENLQVTLNEIKKNEEMKAKIRSATLYPLIIVGVLLVVAIGISIFILPRISGIYSNFDIELPWISRVVLEFSKFSEEKGSVFYPALLITMATLWFLLFINRGTKKYGQALLLRTPLISNLIREVELARVGYLLNNLTQKSFPISESLKLAADSTEIYQYKKMYLDLHQQISKGKTFKQAFNNRQVKRLLPLYVRQVITTGENTGKLDQAFSTISKKYEKQNELSSKDIATVIEPFLLVVIWVFVLFMALSIVLPVYGFIGTISSEVDRETSNDAPIVTGN